MVAKEDDNVERVRDLSMVTSDASKQAHSGVLGGVEGVYLFDCSQLEQLQYTLFSFFTFQP